MKPLTILTIYLIFMNLLAFLLMGLDKAKARRNRWRIPEKTLFLSSILGGSIGAILGMQVFRHKTKHANPEEGFILFRFQDRFLTFLNISTMPILFPS